MMSRILAGACAAALGLGAAAAKAQGCAGPSPCEGGYAPASPAYVFQPGPTPAYQGGYGQQGFGQQSFGPQGFGPMQGSPPPPYAQQGYPEPYGQVQGPGMAPYSYPQPQMHAGPQTYNYIPAYGRGAFADRPYTGPGYGYNGQGGGCGSCAPPAPAFQPCANACGYSSDAYTDQTFAPAPVAHQTGTANVEVSPDFFYGGLAGGSGGFPEGGGAGGGGSFIDNGFGFSAVNNFQRGFANANVFSNTNAFANANASASAHAYAQAHAYAMARSFAYGHAKMYGHGVKSGCPSCAMHAGHHP